MRCMVAGRFVVGLFFFGSYWDGTSRPGVTGGVEAHVKELLTTTYLANG